MADAPTLASQQSHTSLTDDLKLPKLMTAIVGFTEVNIDPTDTHVEYEIKVAVGSLKWTIMRRYSQFLALYETLERQHGSKAGHLPGKTIFASKTSGSVSTSRQTALNQWLESLLLGELGNAAELHLFLEVKGHVLTPPTKFVLIPLPDKDFDPTEAAVPWKLLSLDGIGVHFATPTGSVAAADPFTLGTGPSRLPLKFLEAEPEAKAFYREMASSPSFLSPLPFSMIAPSSYAAILLPGGHAPGMKQYLESAALQEKIVEFSKLNRPIAAICHGVLLLARCRDRDTGLSVIGNEKITTLTNSMEKSGYLLTAPFHGRLYRTYETYCEDEVVSLLPSPSQMQQGPSAGTAKGTLYDDTPAFVVESGKLLTARWPDAYMLGKRLVRLLS